MPIPLPAALVCPPPTPEPTVQVEVVTAGLISADWAQVVDDGTTGEVLLPSLVGVIHHPEALVTVDAGLGLTTRDGTYPGFPLNKMGEQTVPEGTALIERLGHAPDLVLMTHLHYDHVGGLLDMPGTKVWTTRDDWRAFGGGAPGFGRRMKKAVDWRPHDVRPGHAQQVLGQPALDVLGDGTIWYLSLPGHTPGAAAVLVRAEDGPWLFVGDTAWVDKHLEGARRPPLVRAIINADNKQVADGQAWAGWLKANCPDLRVIAGHEPTLTDGVHSTPGG